jgi:type II secretory pathway pseudopilin PulG
MGSNPPHRLRPDANPAAIKEKHDSAPTEEAQRRGILIVIIVLGILAAIVVFAVGTTRKDSVAASCKTNYKSVELSAEAVNTNQGAYPIGAVTAATASNPLVTGGVTPANGALLKAFPPQGDYGFEYTGAADGKSYTMQVLNKAGTPVMTTATSSTPAAAITGFAGCSAL